ncbi:cyclin-D1-binding protein 1 homolog isoform X3 [Syngnathus scovelli]|uniref:cyclin-D1-binding protein 1 homolog isoform X3 n=1 Tax=Syngnathus scovelli TaxID=161590 RepID=UPI0035CCA5BC
MRLPLGVRSPIEANESDGDFNLSNVWDTLNQAAKAVSQEAPKLCLAFSKPPLPSQQDVGQLADSVLKSVLSLSTVYYWLPNSRGVTLRQQVRDAVVQALEGLTQLLEVILTSPLQSLTQEQLTSTGVCGQHVTASPAYHMTKRLQRCWS